jgi:hypothetical protein
MRVGPPSGWPVAPGQVPGHPLSDAPRVVLVGTPIPSPAVGHWAGAGVLRVLARLICSRGIASGGPAQAPGTVQAETPLWCRLSPWWLSNKPRAQGRGTAGRPLHSTGYLRVHPEFPAMVGVIHRATEYRVITALARWITFGWYLVPGV